MLHFTKAHGTGNDFLVLGADSPDLTGDQVARLCNRHFGIGADGLLRVVPASQLGRPTSADWFMDYRNADGSLAETCGNGLRVFARYLVEHGLESRGTFTVATRGNDVNITVGSDDLDFTAISVQMGKARPGPTAEVRTETGNWSGIGVFVPNPHCVVFLAPDEEAGLLQRPPQITPGAFPDGVNVEFVQQAESQLHMRTFERGVGETLSCGSGACAAAWAAAQLTDAGETWQFSVRVIGGELTVSSVAGEIILTGPAQVVATGEVADGLWR